MEEKEKEDPWKKDNIEDTIEKRNNDRQNLINVIQAMDSQLVHEVTKILKEHSDGSIPDWSLLDENSKKYNKDVAELVKGKIDEVYSIDSELHPLKGIIDKAKIEKNYFNEQLVKGLYFPHTEDLKKAIGSKDYMRTMKKHHDANLEEVAKRTTAHMVSDIDTGKHAKGIIEYIKDKHNYDSDKVEEDLMKNDIHQLMLDQMVGQIDKETIQRKYKKYEKAA